MHVQYYDNDVILHPPRALEEIVKLGGNPRLEEIIQRLSLIYKETEGEK